MAIVARRSAGQRRLRPRLPRPGGGPTVVILALVAFLSPVIWTAMAAFGIVGDAGRRPPTLRMQPTFAHFAEVGVAAPSFWQEIGASLLISAGAALLSVAVAFLAAYALARSGSQRQRTTGQIFLVLASLPVMAYVLPLGALMQRFNVADTVIGVLFAEAAVTAPLAIYVLRGFLAQLSPEWEEAAVIEGASSLRVLMRVVVPLSSGTLVATAAILFVLDWNLLLVPLVVAGVDVKTVPVAMVDFFTFERELDWPTAAAALTVSVLPLVIVLAAFHRLIERFTLDSGSRR